MNSTIPAAKRALLDQVTDALRGVPNVEAVALGGSHARGTHRPDSDLDVTIYYREASPFSIVDIAHIARRFSTGAAPTVTEFYGWGPFVNGGAWIDNSICKIDFLYRNLDQLERTIRDAEAGKWEHSYDQQPPFGFRSVTTLGEIQCCRPLHDPNNVLAPMKSAVAAFPPKLKSRILQDTLWCAEFTLAMAQGFARTGDVPNTVGCMTRIFHYLVQALFALNETYFLNDKRVLSEIGHFPQRPRDFPERVSTILAHPGATAESLSASLAALQMLFDEIVVLSGDTYRPKFTLR